MSQQKYARRIATAAGSLAGLAAAPTIAEATVITVTGSPISLSLGDATSLPWDIDPVNANGDEFELRNYSKALTASGYPAGSSRRIFLTNRTSSSSSPAQLNGRGLLVYQHFQYIRPLNVTYHVPTNLNSNYWRLGSVASANLMTSQSSGAKIVGKFVEGDNFMGFRFQDPNDAGGQLHYGYALINFNTGTGTVTIDKWRYESDVDTSIHVQAFGAAAVPEPGSLALLASGAAGLLAYRRRRRPADKPAAEA